MGYTPNAISGPASSVSGNLPSFNNTTGNSVADSGVAVADVVVSSDIGTAAAADIGVTAGDVVQVDQAITATTRATTTTLGTSLNHTLSDTSADIDTFNGVAGVTYSCRALGAGTIVAGAGLIITQTGATITTAAGDTFDVEMITGTTCRIKNYQRASGGALVSTGTVTTIMTPQATTSGSTKSFAIPADAVEVTLFLNGVSSNGTGNYVSRIGTGGTPTTAGYEGSAASSSTSSGITTGATVVVSPAAATVSTGAIVWRRADPTDHTWVAISVMGRTGSGGVPTVGGASVTLGDVLGYVDITTTDAWDAGEVGCQYKVQS
jgi:hypothetical protein